MRTANECLDAIADAYNCPDVAITEAIQSIIDEAVAHGMTISAEITRNAPVYASDIPGCKMARHEILTARDNKVWKKEQL